MIAIPTDRHVIAPITGVIMMLENACENTTGARKDLWEKGWWEIGWREQDWREQDWREWDY